MTKMKNYKIIVPVIIAGLFVLSVYFLFTQRADTNTKYDECLQAARSLTKEEIYVDAEKKYLEAQSIKDSKELKLEIAEFYLNAKQDKKAIGCGESIVESFPHETDGYEFLMKTYLEKKDYVSCWLIYDRSQKRKVQSDYLNETIEGIENEFFFNCDYEDVGVYGDGLCSVKVGDYWGFVNETGDQVIDAKFKAVSAFSGNDLAAVTDIKGDSYFIDSAGNKKKSVSNIEKVEQIGFIEDDTFPVFDGKQWAFYDLEGNKVFGDFSKTTSAGNGIAACVNDEKWSLFDIDGHQISDSTYESVVCDEKDIVIRNDRIFVQQDGKYLMVDSSANVISSNTYTSANLFNDSTYAAVENDGKWGYIDKNGNTVIDYQYEDARSFSNGYAAVKQNGAWGFINKDNKFIIQPQFSEAKDFNSKGAVFVKKDKMWKLLRLYKFNH